MDLRDKVIVITGASSGFGEAIARRCAQRGARVVLAARSQDKLEQLAAELGAAAGRALAVPCDITRDEDVARLAATVLERYGHVDVLVANAGFGVLDRIDSANLEDLQHMIEVNLYGTTRCIQAFLRHMQGRRNGQVVIMASLAGLIATANLGFYCATKFALVGLGRTLMLELYGTGVRCALICPGVAPTNFQRRADTSKYPRMSWLTFCSVEQVAAATVRAIEQRTHGEVIVPWFVRPLARIGNSLPGLARIVLRIIG